MANRNEKEPIRWVALQRFMDRRGLKVLPWSKKAGLAKGTLQEWKSNDRVSGQLSTYEKLAEAAGVSIDDFLRELRGEMPLVRLPLRVLGVADLLSLGAKNMQSAAAFSDRPILPNVYADQDNDQIAAVRIEDTSISYHARPGGFAVVDWSITEPVPGQLFLILHAGRAMVREYRSAPSQWVARSVDPDGTWPAIEPAMAKVIAAVVSFHIPIR